MSFEYLPGIQVTTNDRGLAPRQTLVGKTTVILGTAARGPADTPYQVTDRAVAVQLFGAAGSLIPAMEEAAQSGADNLVLFRIGTKPAVLKGVSATQANLANGVTITFGQRSADAMSRYRVYYKSGANPVLEIWWDDLLVYSNNATNPVDLGDVEIEGALTGAGMDLEGTGSNNFQKALTLTQISNLTNRQVDHDNDPNTPDITLYAPAVTAPVDGLSMTKRKLYIALQKAYDLLSIMTVERVVAPDAVFDNPNVAFYVASDSSTAIHNPATNPNALDWLKTEYDAAGNAIYHWASETTDSEGGSRTPQTFASAAARLAAGYHEVSFGYQMARFCAVQSENMGGCLGFIGVRPPASYKPKDLRLWIGKSPVKDADGKIVTAGFGLAGDPYLSGTTQSKLNPLCSGITSGYRKPGFFQTSDPNSPTKRGEYDMTIDSDANGYPVDIGAYIHVVGATGIVTNGLGSYVKNLAAVVAGLSSVLDDKNALTNKVAPRVTQIYRLNMSELDTLTKAKVNELRFKALGQPPVLLHDRTAATEDSDYIFLQRQQIKFLVVRAIFQEAEPFIGQASSDGLQLAALRTALDRRGAELAKRGYLAGVPNFKISTTEVDRRIGRAYIDVTFNPADQLIQLRARVAISR